MFHSDLIQNKVIIDNVNYIIQPLNVTNGKDGTLYGVSSEYLSNNNNYSFIVKVFTDKHIYSNELQVLNQVIY